MSDEPSTSSGAPATGEAEKPYAAPDLALVGAEHVRRYRETDGEVGHLWNGVTALLLTTVGRRSGEERTSALIYGKDGENHVVIASQGGAPTHPAWYLNLQAQPQAEIQVGKERFAVVARTAEGDERDRLWRLMAGIWPNYDAYRTRTTRRIPVVVLEPAPEA